MILSLPGETFFANNYQVRAFIQVFCDNLRCQDYLKILYIQKEDKYHQIINTLFLDISVYSKNRHFRLLHFGKCRDAGSRIFQCISPTANGMVKKTMTKELFYKSLVTYYGKTPKNSVMTLKWEYSHNISPNVLNADSVNSQKRKYDSPIPAEVQKFSKIITYFKDSVLKTWGSFYAVNNASNLLQIQNVLYYEKTGRLIIRPGQNRFCKNINRNQKRNGIFFVIDLEKFNFTQRCMDYDCRGFQSQAIAIDPALFLSG